MDESLGTLGSATSQNTSAPQTQEQSDLDALQDNRGLSNVNLSQNEMAGVTRDEDSIIEQDQRQEDLRNERLTGTDDKRKTLAETSQTTAQRAQSSIDSGFDPSTGLPLADPFVGPDPRVEFDVELCGVGFRARQYIGVGDLNVLSNRGEGKAKSGDFLLVYGDERIVMSASLFERLAHGSGREDIIPFDEWSARRILNNKSGPDKFTFPMEPIGGERTDSPPAANTLSNQVRSTTASRMPLTQGGTAASRPESPVTRQDISGTHDREMPPAPLTLEELRLKVSRGEILNSAEELRLMEGNKSATNKPVEENKMAPSTEPTQQTQTEVARQTARTRKR